MSEEERRSSGSVRQPPGARISYIYARWSVCRRCPLGRSKYPPQQTLETVSPCGGCLTSMTSRGRSLGRPGALEPLHRAYGLLYWWDEPAPANDELRELTDALDPRRLQLRAQNASRQCLISRRTHGGSGEGPAVARKASRLFLSWSHLAMLAAILCACVSLCRRFDKRRRETK